MLKRLLLGWFLTLAALSWGQGALFSDSVSNQYGKPVPYAQVRICSPGSTGQPCSPLALLYTDETMGTALSNPVYADKNGNYRFYAPPGFYVRQILINNVVRDEQKIMVGVSKEYVDANAGGVGTVTHSTGALESNVLMAGAGSGDAKVLAADPANCSTGQASTGIDKTGAAKGCFTPTGTGTVTHASGPLTSGSLVAGNGTSDVAVLASDPAACSGGQVPVGIDKTGAAKGCFTPTTSSSLPALTENSGDVTSTKKLIVPEIQVPGSGPTVINVTATTIASLPSTPTTGDYVAVSNAVSPTDCTVGGGSYLHYCRWNGSAWTADNISANQINGVSLSSLATGILKNTNGTGVPSIAANSDFPSPTINGVVCALGGTCTIAPTVTVSTSGPVTVAGPAAYYWNNAAGALTFNLPAPVAGYQFCFSNDTGKSGAITLQLPASTYMDKTGANGTAAGTLVSGGALGDAVCVVAKDTTHYKAYVQSGTWTNN